jgi:hypothetical protein
MSNKTLVAIVPNVCWQIGLISAPFLSRIYFKNYYIMNLINSIVGFIINNISEISVIVDILLCVCLLILAGEFRKIRKSNQ